ncbi:peroxiredoxin [Rhodobacteraceae bacterium M385]|nr:peroxiredoxin [Rhodobacteraceae bacterium M385]
MLETGHPAPDFTLPRDGGTTLTLSDQRPKAVVLFFYPKDDTPGCTKEAIAFTGLEAAFAEANTTLIGISKDTATKHDKFIAKHDLSIALVSDAEHDTCEQYGTWVEKNMYGKKYMGIERATYLIDSDGNIAQIWRKVKVPGHAEAVLEAARAL